MSYQIPSLFNRADLDRNVVALVAALPIEDKRTFKRELEEMATLSEDQLPLAVEGLESAVLYRCHHGFDTAPTEPPIAEGPLEGFDPDRLVELDEPSLLIEGYTLAQALRRDDGVR